MAGRDVQKGTYAVIMAGGRGERLWPLSTPEKPKQFLKLTGNRTMLQETVDRLSPLIPKENIYVVIPKDFRKLVLEQLEIPQENLIVEPLGRSTAPCVGLAAVMLEAKDPQGVMAVLPADHVIKKSEKFLEILKKAIEVASSGTYLVTLGIVPDHPATGYGYIHRGELFTMMDGIEVYKIQSFTEKPDKETVTRFLGEGGYYWNSGMFIWRVDTILAEIERHMPKLHSSLMKIKEHLGKSDLDMVIEEVYREQESISIDYGVMECSFNVLMIPAEIGWSDVGDWPALGELLPADQEGNVIHACHLGVDTEGCIVFAEDPEHLVATIGLKDMVMVDTGRALLVMPKGGAQEVRRILELLRKTGFGELRSQSAGSQSLPGTPK